MASDHNSARARRHEGAYAESKLRKEDSKSSLKKTKKDRMKTREVKAYKKYQKAKESGDGKKTMKKYDKLVKRQNKSIEAGVEVNYSDIKKEGSKSKLKKKEEGKEGKKGKGTELPTFTVTYSKKDEDMGLKNGITTHKPTKEMIKAKLDSQKPKKPKSAKKKGSVHYKTGPIQYQHSSNLRMDDMVSTVGPLQGSDGESTVTQVSPMGKKANIVHKMASKRNMLKKMDAMHNGEPGVQKEDFEQFKK
tara:strand:+ start:25 stop:768 length:744 start_codon:yes stop_codon:yes gene_type:complete